MTHLTSETQHRLYGKLYRDLGDEIISLLEDKNINEIMLNPDGAVWVDNVAHGLMKFSKINRTRAFSIIHGVAGIHDVVIQKSNPRLEVKLPFYKNLQGQRFTAQIPPIVSNPSFTIRKKTEVIFTLEDYVASQRITENQKIVIQQLISQRKNILVCGGPGVGKTSVVNALILEAVLCDENQRFVILEDLPELQCTAPNKVAMLTTDVISMSDLLCAAMRMRPDRILIGEVRGKEALDLLKAWNTGCPGGICTVHANSASDAIQRILDLAMEAGLSAPPISLVLHTVDAIVSVTRKDNKKGIIHEILALKEYKNEKFLFEKLG